MDGISNVVGLEGPIVEGLGSTALGLPHNGEKPGLGRQLGEGPVTTESEEPNMAEGPNMASLESLANPPEGHGGDGGRDSGESDRIGTTVPKVIDGEATVHCSSTSGGG